MHKFSPNIVEKKFDLMVGFALFLVAFSVYANSLGNGFVWDDDIVIVGNSALKGGPLDLLTGIDSGRLSELTPYYRPLTLFSFLVEYWVHGLNPFMVRLANVLLHAANTILVYLLIRSFNVNSAGALIAGLLFAVHPLNSEAVNFNAGGRNTMLATFFILSAYLVHKWSVKRNSFAGRCSGAVFFLAGLFSKETALALVPFLVWLEVDNNARPSFRSLANMASRLGPYLICCIIYLLMRNNALAKAGVSVDIFTGLAVRILNNVYIIPRYLLNVVWPVSLSPKYYIPDDLHLLVLPLAAAWLGIAGSLWWLTTRGRSLPVLAGLAWLLAFWLPVSGIFPIPSAPLADRYLYLPAIGVWLIAADLLGRCKLSPDKVRDWRLAASGAVLVTLAFVTVCHNRTWHNDVVLFSRLIAMYPDRAYGHHNLGCAYLDKVKDLDMAEKSFTRALEIDPAFPRLRTQMGYIRLLRGDMEGAIEQYNHAVYLNPFDAEAVLNRGEAYDRLGNYDEAIDSYRRFLSLPRNDLPLARPKVDARVRELEGMVRVR